MASTIRDFVGTSPAVVLHDIDFTLGYLREEFVYVYLDTSEYTDQIPYIWVNDSQILLSQPVDEGVAYHIRRVVPRDKLVLNYTDGALLREKNLDDSFRQPLMVMEEIQDGFQDIDGNMKVRGTLDMQDNALLNMTELDMQGNKIVDVADAVDAQDAVTLKQLQQVTIDLGGFAVTPIVSPRQIADGIATVFPTSASEYVVEAAFFIHFDGVQQRPNTDFTIDITGNVVFTVAPEEGTLVDITLFQPRVVAEEVRAALRFSTVEDMVAANPQNFSNPVIWADYLGNDVTTVVHNTTSNEGGARYTIVNANPDNLSTLVGGIWVGANHDLGGGFYAKRSTTQTDLDLSSVAADVAQNATDIADNVVDIAKNATDISDNGVNIAQNATDISSLNASVDGLSSGYITYATKALLDANLAHDPDTLAQVWNDLTPENNGVYGKIGATGVGSWVKSPALDPLTVVNNTLYDTTLKLSTGVVAGGELFNGAAWWDGTTTVGATGTSGGFLVPSGQSGANTYQVYIFNFSQGELSALPGRTARFFIYAETSTDFLDEFLGFLLPTSVVGTAGTFSNKTVYPQGDKNVILRFDYQFSGDETQITIALQVNPSQTAIAADASILALSQTWGLMDEMGANYALDKTLEPVTTNTATALATANTALMTSGNNIASIKAGGELFNGASFIDYGLSVPAGITGTSSYVHWPFSVVHLAEFAGSKIRLSVSLDTSVNLQSNQTSTIGINGSAGTSVQEGAMSRTVVSTTKQVLQGTYEIRGTPGETVGIYMQLEAPVNSAAIRSFFMTENKYWALSANEPETQNNLNFDSRLATLSSSGGSPVTYVNTYTVKKDGTGDFTSLLSACAVVAGVSYSRRSLIKVYEGVYAENNYYIPNYVDVIGIGQAGSVWLKARLPESTAPATIQATQTIWMNKTSTLTNLKITCQNMRYPIHSDSGASKNKATQYYIDCDIEHLGNDEARQWQTDNGGDPNLIWGAEYAFGCGTHSGEIIKSIRTKWRSKVSPFYFHTNKDFTEPCYVEIDGGVIDCANVTGNNAIAVQSFGSGQPDRLTVKGAVINGILSMNDSPWLSTKIENQPANHNEVAVNFIGCDRVAWKSDTTNSVLELRSIDSATSSVVVSGAGADVLFGRSPDYRAGGIGYAGRAYSSLSIREDITGTSLAARLGDLSGAPKALNITFDGSLVNNISLDANYTGMTNAAIITSLNVKLADGTRGFYSSNPWQNAATVINSDNTIAGINSGSTAILKGMGVVKSTSDTQFRVATSADDVSIFVGVAMNNASVGEQVIVDEEVFNTHMLTNSALTISFGSTVQISVVDGRFETGATNPVMRCSNPRGVFSKLG